MKWNIRNLFMLFAGLCLGIFVGVLVAPTTGAVVRSGLLYHLKSYRKKLQAFIMQLIGSRNSIKNQAKSMGQEVITDVLHAAEKILKEFDTLSEQLGQSQAKKR